MSAPTPRRAALALDDPASLAIAARIIRAELARLRAQKAAAASRPLAEPLRPEAESAAS